MSIKSTSAAFSRALPNHNFRLDEYHTLRDIYAYVDALSLEYPSFVRSFDIGSTHEQRPIKAIEITQNASDSDFVWLDSLTHAREWITGSTLVYIIDSIVAAHARPLASEQVSVSGRAQLRNKNFIIIPVVNPDGYEHTWTSNRLWRKNRAPNGKCLGVSTRFLFVSSIVRSLVQLEFIQSCTSEAVCSYSLSQLWLVSTAC